jgi:hypothetical protein
MKKVSTNSKKGEELKRQKQILTWNFRDDPQEGPVAGGLVRVHGVNVRVSI